MREIINWFGNNSNAAFTTFIVSVVAVVISGIAFMKTKRTDKRLLEIEEKREEDRNKLAQKAQLQARIVKYGHNSHRLLIINNGEGEARNIGLKMDAKPFDDHFASVRNDSPAKIIGPHSEATCLLHIADECAPPWKIEISWEDDSGEPGHYKSTLTF